MKQLTFVQWNNYHLYNETMKICTIKQLSHLYNGTINTFVQWNNEIKLAEFTYIFAIWFNISYFKPRPFDLI